MVETGRSKTAATEPLHAIPTRPFGSDWGRHERATAVDFQRATGAERTRLLTLLQTQSRNSQNREFIAWVAQQRA